MQGGAPPPADTVNPVFGFNVGAVMAAECLGLSVYRCVAAGIKPKTTARERCDGARVQPNPLCPLPLGHCWNGQTREGVEIRIVVRRVGLQMRQRKNAKNTAAAAGA